MRKQAEEMQRSSKQNLGLLKARYEAKLNMLKAEHRAAIKANDELRNNIRLVNATNEDLVKQATKLQKSISILNGTFSALQEKVNAAEGFIGDSLNETEVDGSPEVQVLVQTTPEPTLEYFLSKARQELGLNVSKVTQPTGQGTIVDVSG